MVRIAMDGGGNCERVEDGDGGDYDKVVVGLQWLVVGIMKEWWWWGCDGGDGDYNNVVVRIVLNDGGSYEWWVVGLGWSDGWWWGLW